MGVLDTISSQTEEPHQDTAMKRLIRREREASEEANPGKLISIQNAYENTFPLLEPSPQYHQDSKTERRPTHESPASFPLCPGQPDCFAADRKPVSPQ